MDQMADMVEKISSGLKPAYENFMGFFHAIDWKEPWVIGLVSFYVLLLLVAFRSRKNVDFQMMMILPLVAGVNLGEKLNHLLDRNWKSFAGKNYFDSEGVFVSKVWSGPLMVIAILILVNTSFLMYHIVATWKRDELIYRASLARDKQD